MLSDHLRQFPTRLQLASTRIGLVLRQPVVGNLQTSVKRWSHFFFQIHCFRIFARNHAGFQILWVWLLFKSRVEKNPIFSKKNNPPVFVFFKRFFRFFLNETRSFFQENATPILNCFYCIMQCHHFQNYTNDMLHLFWHSKLRVKKCTPSLFSLTVVGQFTSRW